jgi:hypothetical protein
MVFVEVGSPYILVAAQAVFSCKSVWQIIHVHAVLSLPSCLGTPGSSFLEFGLGYFCIGLSISRK